MKDLGAKIGLGALSVVAIVGGLVLWNAGSSTEVTPVAQPVVTTEAAPVRSVVPTVKPHVRSRPHVVTRKAAPAPRPRPHRSPSAAPKPQAHIVHAGAFCKPVGATGVTVTGRHMRCIKKPGEKTARWRA